MALASQHPGCQQLCCAEWSAAAAGPGSIWTSQQGNKEDKAPVWLLCAVASRLPMALPCPLAEHALRDGVCGGSTSPTLALGTLGMCLLPKKIPAAVPL